jgi:hypothetical protein
MASDKPKGIISLSGRDYPTWAFVLAKAHDMGLLGIETELLQIPSADNGEVAITRAVATFAPIVEGGPLRRFSGIGDACPENVNQKAKLHLALIRMAETRAMGRALRTGTNIGETMFEEMPDLEETRGDRYAREMPPEKFGAPRATIAGQQAAARQERPLVRHEPGTPTGDAAMAQATPVCGVEGCGVVLRPAQVVLSEQKHGRRLCAAHQDDEASK